MVDPVNRLPMAERKKGKGAPASFRGEFSFVNKDATNISSKEHHNAVSWHVMNRYERFKKQEEARKLRASAHVPVTPVASTSSPQKSPEVGSSSLDSPYGELLTLLDQNEPLTMSPPWGFDPWFADHPLQLGYPSTTTGQSPMSSLSTPSSRLEDPFSKLKLPGTQPESTSSDSLHPLDLTDSSLVNSLVGFTYERIIPEIWPSGTDSPSVVYEVGRSSNDVATIYQDSCYANAYLSLIAGMKATAESDEALRYYARMFQGQAMSELKQRLSQTGPQDLVTMKAILKLFSSETIIDNTSAARMHLKMLRNLVIASGGIVLQDPWFTEDLLCTDSYFALKYETRPLIPAQGWSQGSLNQSWKVRLTSAGIYGDHAATLDSLVEYPVLKAVLTDLRELLKVHEYTLSRDVPADDQLLRWRQMRRFECISRLADHAVNLKIYPHLHDNPKTQAAATTAAALLANLILGSPEPVRFGLKLFETLKQAYLESEAEQIEDKDRLRLWLLYIGSLAENVHPVPLDIQQDWFRSRLREVGSRLNIRNWDDMRKVLRQFLFSERLQREIAGGRAHRSTDFSPGLYSISGISWRLPLTTDHVEDELGSNWKGKQRRMK